MENLANQAEQRRDAPAEKSTSSKEKHWIWNKPRGGMEKKADGKAEKRPGKETKEEQRRKAAVDQGQKERYTLTDKLGEGTYGVVYKAIDNKLNAVRAIKKMRLDMEDEGVPPTAIREISLLKELSRHPNIVTLHSTVQEHSRLYLVFEFLTSDLKGYMDNQVVSSRLVKKWTYQILSAVDFCHSRRILHRDLKPPNLLIDEYENIKLGDFGLARAFGVPMREYTHEVVTLWYRSPEVLLGTQRYSTCLDVWSIGCIVAEMWSGIPLFSGDSEIDQLYKIFQLFGTPTEEVWPGVTQLPDFKSFFPQWEPMSLRERVPGLSGTGLHLLQEFLHYSPPQRISARKALCHEWFQNLSADVQWPL